MKIITSSNNEDNGYHDSYFYSVIFNTETGKFEKHNTHTTAGAGYNPVPPECIPFVSLTQPEINRFQRLAKQEAENAINSSSTPFIGDTVEVTKGRKYAKGLKFIVTKRSVYRDTYGRVKALYLHGDDGIKISKDNCTILARRLCEVHLMNTFLSLTRTGYANHLLEWNSQH